MFRPYDCRRQVEQRLIELHDRRSARTSQHPSRNSRTVMYRAVHGAVHGVHYSI